MKISLSWVATYLNSSKALESLKKQASVLEQRMPLVGLEVGSRKKLSEGIEDVVTAEILSFEKHPEADRLNVCKVKVSDKEIYSIVCGASNVKQGLKVALAREGCVLPGNFKIKKSKIRGVESSGMLCSESELGLADASEGILELPAKTTIGRPLVAALGLDDEVWEFELTPDRADCLSHVGLARELGRYVGASVQLPEYEKLNFEKSSDVPLISLEVQAKRACPFYSAQLLEGFKTIETPQWMSSHLQAVGQRPKNALVDITNYVLMELGQPLHAFDADKIEGSKLIVRYAKKGESLVTLDGVERKLFKEDLVIADSKGPVAIAGVMGGLESAVSNETKRVILESAYFNADSIRGTVQRHKIHSESSHRFERGVDPNMALVGAGRALKLFKDICGCRRRGALVHFQAKTFSKKLEAHTINLDLRAFKKVTGLDLQAKEISDHLATLEIGTESRSAKVLKVFVPTHRVDLLREIDLIEEVARLAGFDGIPTRFPAMLSVSKPITEGTFDLIQKLRVRMLGTSFVELMPYCFFSDKEKEYAPDVKYVSLENPLSHDWKYMRSNLSTGLLRSLASSTAKGEYRAKFFEASTVFEKRTDLTDVALSSPTKESLHVSWVLLGQRNKDHWSSDKSSVARKEQFDFFDAKGAADLIAQSMATQDRIWQSMNLLPLWKVYDDPKLAPYVAEMAPWIPMNLLHPGRSAIYFTPGKKGPQTNVMGFVGELHPLVKSDLLNVATGKELGVAFGELRCVEDLWKSAYEKSTVAKILKKGSITASSKFPFIERDLAFVFEKSLSFDDIAKVVHKQASDLLVSLDCLDVYPQEDGRVSVAMRLLLQSQERTLEDNEVASLIEKTTSALVKTFKAEQRV
ncbi:phenylalanine--tRNA ligase subunit beta [bacterium]|nr:phenylalanine--tRNA ligase subunit beta [bacterium]